VKEKVMNEGTSSGFLEGLNPDQLTAVKHEEGPLLVLAGPGSGKTRVITCRMAHLVSAGISPWNILCVTFTNKAANEMKRRVETWVNGRGLWIGTFHSISARILRSHAESLGRTPHFTIYDRQDQLQCVTSIIKGFGRAPSRSDAQLMLSSISRAKGELLTPEAYLLQYGDWGYYKEVAAVYEAYVRLLKKQDALDFDDLLFETFRLLRDQEELRRLYQNKFRYILVDEYQDTNLAQYQWVLLMGQSHKNVCVAGDPNQSIYAFRGARVHNILDFEKDFPETKIVPLGKNYRSTRTVLDLANRLVEFNPGKRELQLWTDNERGERPRVIVGEEEADLVAQEVRSLLNGGTSPGDIAIFFRMNAQSRAFEHTFTQWGIPHVVVGSLRFFERKEIKDALAYLRLLLSPTDDMSALRIINEPARGIGQKTVELLVKQAKERDCSFLEAARFCVSGDILPSRATKALSCFLIMLDEIMKAREGKTLPDLLDLLMRISGYEASLAKDDTEMGQSRRENIAELRASLEEFEDRFQAGEEEGKGDSLAEYLQQVSLVTDVDRWDSTVDAVVLMTLHSAKGLEFPVVFMTGMLEGLLPHSRSLQAPEEVEEERRLCYVGITRAKKNLFFSLSTKLRFNEYGTIEPEPSRFLSEMDVEQELVSARDVEEGDELEPFEPGDYVRHPQWGLGQIRRIRGVGDNAVATIDFDYPAGTKRVALAVAPLSRP